MIFVDAIKYLSCKIFMMHLLLSQLIFLHALKQNILLYLRYAYDFESLNLKAPSVKQKINKIEFSMLPTSTKKFYFSISKRNMFKLMLKENCKLEYLYHEWIFLRELIILQQVFVYKFSTLSWSNLCRRKKEFVFNTRK